MQDVTKKYLEQLVIDLHYQSSQESKPELRKIADDISDVLKKERDALYRL
jgi:hypothetical protein